MKKAAFIGAGNMGGVLIEAACQTIGPEEVVIASRTRARADALAARVGCSVAESNEEAARDGTYIFLCVKPQILPKVVHALAPVLAECRSRGEEKVLVSIAAGVRVATIRGWLADQGVELPILRVMPNTCAAIGQGMTALAGEGEAHLSTVEGILAQTGWVERIDESLMDPFASVTGCGTAYVYQFIEALADGGVLTGLPRRQAQIYAAQMVQGAAAMVLKSGEHPGALKDAVCSPGGSTIAGIAALERGGFRSAVIEAVAAACQKNRELGGG